MASLRDELLAVREKHGQLTPQVTVDEARDPNHPLHSRFEWDDAVAGEAYRLEQARHLIRSVKLTVQKGPRSKPKELRAFLSVQHEGGYSYEPAEEVAQDPFMRQVVLQNMKREIDQLVQRYQDYEEFFAILRKVLKAG